MTLLGKRVFILLLVFCSAGFGVQAGPPKEKEADFMVREAPISDLVGVIFVNDHEAFLSLKSPFTEAMFVGNTPFGQALEEVIDSRVLNDGHHLDHNGQYIRQTYRDASDESSSVSFQLTMCVSSSEWEQNLIVESSGNNLLRVIQSQKSVLQLHGNEVNTIHNYQSLHFAVGVPSVSVPKNNYIAKCTNSFPVVSPYFEKAHRVYVVKSKISYTYNAIEFHYDSSKFTLKKIEISGKNCELFTSNTGKLYCTPEHSHCPSGVQCPIYAYLDLISHPGLIVEYKTPVNFEYKDAFDHAFVIANRNIELTVSSVELKQSNLNITYSLNIGDFKIRSSLTLLVLKNGFKCFEMVRDIYEKHFTIDLKNYAKTLGTERHKNLTIVASYNTGSGVPISKIIQYERHIYYEFKVNEMSVKREFNTEQTLSTIESQWEFNLPPNNVADVADNSIQLRFSYLHNGTLIHTIDDLRSDTIKESKTWIAPKSLKFEPFRVELFYLKDVLSSRVSEIPDFVLLDSMLVESRPSQLSPDQILHIQWRSHDGRVNKQERVKGELICESSGAYKVIENMNEINQLEFTVGEFSCPENLVLSSHISNKVEVPNTAQFPTNDAILVNLDGEPDLVSEPGHLKLKWLLEVTDTYTEMKNLTQDGTLTVIFRDTQGVEISSNQWDFISSLRETYSMTVPIRTLLQSFTRGKFDWRISLHALDGRNYKGRNAHFDFLHVTNFHVDRLSKQLLKVTWTPPAVLAPPSYLDAITLHLHYIDPASGEPYQPVIVKDLKSGYAELSLPDLRPIHHVEMIHGSNQFIAMDLVEATDDAYIYKSGALDQLQMYPDENLVTTWRVIGGKKVSKVPASLQCKDKTVEIQKLKDVFGDRQLQLKAQTLMNAGCFDASSAISSSVLTLHTASNIALLTNVTMIQSFTISNMQYKMVSSDIHFSWTVFPRPDADLLATLQITVVGREEAVLVQNVNLATGIFVAKSVSLPDQYATKQNPVWTLLPHRKLKFDIAPQELDTKNCIKDTKPVLIVVFSVFGSLFVIALVVLLIMRRKRKANAIAQKKALEEKKRMTDYGTA